MCPKVYAELLDTTRVVPTWHRSHYHTTTCTTLLPPNIDCHDLTRSVDLQLLEDDGECFRKRRGTRRMIRAMNDDLYFGLCGHYGVPL